MKPTKAYILRIDTPTSIEYAKTCADSCDKIGMPWEYFQGVQNKTIAEAWASAGVYVPMMNAMYGQYQEVHAAQCCTAGHAAIWKKIAEGDEAAIVLEHDAIMLHPIDIDIPDDMIVTLGYKLSDPSRYDHENAGVPTRIIRISGHEGAHAYALTPHTARVLIEEIGSSPSIGNVDNRYFIRGQRNTYASLGIMDPTPAIGWLRKSTIWDESAERNYEFINSFKNNLK
jgi:hypothetical protein